MLILCTTNMLVKILKFEPTDSFDMAWGCCFMMLLLGNCMNVVRNLLDLTLKQDIYRRNKAM